MHLSEQDAAAIYARACVAWYGGKARHVVREQIGRMRRKGDLSGVRVWSRVAAELSRVPDGRAKRVAGGKLY